MEFSCLCTNADSLSNKMGTLTELVNNLNPMIIGITEVYNPKSAPPMQTDRLEIDVYNLFPKCGGGRGVCIYVKSSLNAELCSFDENIPFVESVWAEIKLRDGTMLLIGCIYRSPRSLRPNNDALCSLIKKPNDYWPNVLIMGDFNYGKLTWLEGTHNMITGERQFMMLSGRLPKRLLSGSMLTSPQENLPHGCPRAYSTSCLQANVTRSPIWT